MKQIIATVEAPPALGPYAQGVRAGETIYVSGQLPMDPKTRRLIEGDIAAQTEQVLTNIRAIVEEGGGTFDDIVRITIYLTNLDDFDEMNRVYTMFFPTIDNALTETLPPCAHHSRSLAFAARRANRNGRHRRHHARLFGL